MSQEITNKISQQAITESSPAAAKAWVNFNGTGIFSPNPSTSKIRSSYNVSSITKNGTGDYNVNFTSAMTDANYVLAGSNSFALNTNGSSGAILAPYIKLTSSIQVRTNLINAGQESQMVDVAIFGN